MCTLIFGRVVCVFETLAGHFVSFSSSTSSPLFLHTGHERLSPTTVCHYTIAGGAIEWPHNWITTEYTHTHTIFVVAMNGFFFFFCFWTGHILLCCLLILRSFTPYTPSRIAQFMLNFFSRFFSSKNKLHKVQSASLVAVYSCCREISGDGKTKKKRFQFWNHNEN